MYLIPSMFFSNSHPFTRSISHHHCTNVPISRLQHTKGFNDLGYLGCSTTTTPNIDNLIENESLLLWYNYAFKLCSPSRSAFLSGRNPSNLGLQNLMFAIEYPAALTRQVSILSEEFKANGYSTHIIGYAVCMKVQSVL